MGITFSLSVGHCPVYNTVAEKMDSAVCSGKHCPNEVFTSNDVYKCMITIFNISRDFSPQCIGKINIQMLEALMFEVDEMRILLLA